MAADKPGRRVAWVTGASRGVGRGVAVALGQAGWVVYVTARSTAAGRTGHLPGTVEETAQAVTAAGGLGVPVSCDHRDDEAVRATAGRIEGCEPITWRPRCARRCSSRPRAAWW